MHESLKFLGLLSIILAWVSLLFLFKVWGRDKNMSISKHAAAHKNAYVTMALSESIFLPLYFIFIAFWFVPNFQLPNIFIVITGISVLGTLLAAWIPDATGKRGSIHYLVAYPAYICMILSVLLIAVCQNVSNIAQIFSILAFGYMVFGGIYLATHRNSKDNFLYIQVSFLASIHLSVLAATYIR